MQKPLADGILEKPLLQVMILGVSGQVILWQSGKMGGHWLPIPLPVEVELVELQVNHMQMVVGLLQFCPSPM